jgi:hypothetical protein
MGTQAALNLLRKLYSFQFPNMVELHWFLGCHKAKGASE